MIDVYYFPSPNTWKVTIMLEECGLPYRIISVDTLRGQQHEPQFRRINPNSKVPAIVDQDAAAGPLAVFESGAILLYLAEKTGRLLPHDVPGRFRVLQWLFWQVGGLGPMAGQVHHFSKASVEGASPQALERFSAETRRLYGVLNAELERHEYIAGEYSIADIACWGWVWFHGMHLPDLAKFGAVERWFRAVGERPAVVRGRRVGLDLVPASLRGVLEPDDSGRQSATRPG